MATFSGGETLIGVVRLATSSTGTLYTAPANTYARVYLEKVSMGASASFTIGQHTFTTGGGGSATISSGIKTQSNGAVSVSDPVEVMVLYAGQTISQTTSNGVYATILEFSIP